MKLEGLNAGTRLVTMAGDIVELLEVGADGETARVRYVEVIGAGSAAPDSEATLPSDDIATVDGTRFVGPPRTASTGAG